MKYVSLGKTGLKVSRICLGCMTYGSPKWRPWILSEEQGRPLIRQALEAGINFFDTADMYSLGESEEILGRALKDFAQREQVVIATKVFNSMGQGPNDRGLSRKHIFDAVHASLKRLGTDYIDLYQVHRYDYETPIEETLEALNDLVRSGKVRYLGASSMFAWQFAKSLYLSERKGWSKFISMQNHYNLLYREEEREMLPLCEEEGIGVLPWSPLARGFLAANRSPQSPDTLRTQTDTYARTLYNSPADTSIVERVQRIALYQNTSPASIALAWLLQKPNITSPIIGASKPHHIQDALRSLSISLSAEEMQSLQEPYLPRPVRGHD